jgi:hypothetical protein
MSLCKVLLPFCLHNLDNPVHNVPILGGMWGIRMSLNRNMSNKIYNLVVDKSIGQKYNKNGKSPKGNDQLFLSDKVYKFFVNQATIHDSYSCKKFANSKPFPTERKVVDHVGSVNYAPPDKIQECPIECRPSNHQNWKYC